MMLHYCKKCGRLILRGGAYGEPTCDCCKSEVFPIPLEFLTNSKQFIKEDLKQQFIDEYIKPSPEFDPYLFKHREEILAKEHAEFQAHMEAGRAILEGRKKPIVECPYCHSTDTKKISALSKIGDAMLLGFFSPKIYKLYCISTKL